MWVDLDQFLQYLQYQRRYSGHTVISYQNDISQFISFAETKLESGKIHPREVDTDLIREFLAALLKNELDRRSIARKLSALKSFFRYLQSKGVTPVNPAAVLSAPKQQKKLPTVLSISEARALMEKPPGDTFEGLRDRAILELLYGSGLRLSELLTLTKTQIDWENEQIKVLGKRQKERILPLGSYARKALRQYLDFRKKELKEFENQSTVFLSKKGKPLYPLAVQKMTRRYMEILSEQEHLSPHVLRHTFATHLLDQGADLLVVKELLGHESLSTTQVYTHVSMDRIKKIYRQAHPRSAKTKPSNNGGPQ